MQHVRSLAAGVCISGLCLYAVQAKKQDKAEEKQEDKQSTAGTDEEGQSATGTDQEAQMTAGTDSENGIATNIRFNEVNPCSDM